ncbi:MAG TPA: hypothetical protein VGK59_00765 [Ohtaekwangia sp.]
MDIELLVDILGWIGSIEVVAAYGLNSYQKIKSDSLVFYSLNITGGILLIVYSVYKSAYANTFINVVWVIIAIPAVIRLLQKRSS